MSAQQLITEHIDLWTSTIKARKTQGRGSNKKRELYGITKLRELIFELAGGGLLVEADKSSTKIEKLGSIVELVMGQAPPGLECNKDGDGTIFVKTGEFGELYPDIREWTTKPLKFAKKGDVLICVVGATIGKLNLAIDCAIGRSVAAIRPSDVLETRFLYYSLMPFTQKIRRQSKGSAQGVIGKVILNATEIRVPALAEQHRIVAKVDELMALCDQLEQQTESSLNVHNLLVDTLLSTLTNARNAKELSDSWARLADHFDTLITTDYAVEQLKQTILQLAVMGKLVPQNPNDEPASELLKRIATEKAQLIKEKKIKKRKPLIDFEGLDDLKQKLPTSWRWIRLEDTADIVRGGSPRPAGDPRYYDGEIPFLKVADVTQKTGKYVEGFNATIKEAGLHKTRYIDTRTVLLSNSGATLGIPAICDFPATFNDGVAAFIERSNYINDEYLYLYLATLRQWYLNIASRGQGQPNLNTDIVKATWFALPPLEEQHRIVAKVDELMTLCDQLKACIHGARAIQIKIADALVFDVTGSEIKDIEKMKAPDNELVTSLKLKVSPNDNSQAPLSAILTKHKGELTAKNLWQLSKMGIDVFYQQLKIEMERGWIVEPEKAQMKEKR